MTPAEIHGLTKAAILSAASDWHLSIERLQPVVDKSLRDVSQPPTESDHAALDAALIDQYSLETSIFDPEVVEWPKAA